MTSLWQAFLLTILLFPILVAVLGIAVQKSSKSWITLGWSLLTLMLLVLLYSSPNDTIHFPFSILQNEPMGLSTNRTSIQFMCLLAISGMFITETTLSDPDSSTKWKISINLILFSLAGFVLFASDFLTRLLALELSAFCISLYPLTESELPFFNRWMRVLEIYIPLRIAGAILIAVIFPLAIQIKSFQIELLLDNMQEKKLLFSNLSTGLLLLAVGIKNAAVPFHRWLLREKDSPDPYWAYSALIITGSLASYLLYRFLPLMPDFRSIYLLLAFILALLSSTQILLPSRTIQDGVLLSFSQNISTVFLLLSLRSRSALISFILILLPIVTLLLAMRSNAGFKKYILPVSGLLLIARFYFPLSLFRPVHFEIYEILLFIATLFIQGLSFLLLFFKPHPEFRPEETKKSRLKLEKKEWGSFRDLTQSFVDLEYHLDHLTRYANQMFRMTSKAINRLHNGSLDRYLYWTVIFILLILVFVFIA